MTNPEGLARVTERQQLERSRDEILEMLGIHFSNDDLTMDELEHRLELAFKARDDVELASLVADLPALRAYSSEDSPVTGDLSIVPPRGVIGAIMGGSVRKGSWVVPRHLKVVAIMGGAELDLRNAVLAPGVTEIEVLAIMGGVDLLMPSGVRVESIGMGIMGGFDDSSGDASATNPDQPVIRLSGFALMGGVGARLKAANRKVIKKFNRALIKARKRAGITD